jgi:hypothetical protein
MTNDNGEYVLAPINNGCYRLRFDKDGYESSWYGEPPLKDSAIEVIVAGEKVTEIDAPISSAGSLITGRVKGEDGKPLAGAWVTAFQIEGEDGSISDARTDEKGFFSIGVYRIGELLFVRQKQLKIRPIATRPNVTPRVPNLDVGQDGRLANSRWGWPVGMSNALRPIAVGVYFKSHRKGEMNNPLAHRFTFASASWGGSPRGRRRHKRRRRLGGSVSWPRRKPPQGPPASSG